MSQQTTSIPIGLRHRLVLKVDEALTVPFVSPAFTGFADMPPVFATAFMVAFIEWTCMEALRGHLGPNEATVGTRVDMTHTAPTPIGMTVTAEVELIAADPRKLRFKVRCLDDAGVVGEGIHERAVIDREKFMERVRAKAARRSPGSPGSV
jgi:fluoroacetyl-CoA thioesterase